MIRICPTRCGRLAIGLLLLFVAPAAADDPPKPDSALVRLLKSGRVPEERQPQIIAKIGQLGSPADLAFLLERAADAKGFSPPVRAKALDALADAAITRKGIRPAGNLLRVEEILDRSGGDPASRIAAIRLVGLWKLDQADALVGARLAEKLGSLIERESPDDATRSAAIDAFAAMGNERAIRVYTNPERPKRVRALAVAALARMDPAAAASGAAKLIREAEKGDDLTPLIAAFLNLKGGPDALARAIEAEPMPPDGGKLALRAVYALGRADALLIASLSKAAGISSETKPPTKEEMDRLVADVAAKGDPARGERIFRRADLSCIKCHAIAGAGGGVGPDLSSVGLSAPVDYVINSILVPDQAIKEQFHTLVVATNDGQVFQGIVTDKDESKVVLRQATGELKTVPVSQIDESKEGGSLMPKGLANLLTRDEFLDLVRFISELGKPGPYAIHAVPTIQRWHLMKPVPEDLSASPDAGAFVAKVRDSDPSAWVPAYGLSTGEVPIDEFAGLAGGRVLYLRGEIDVSSSGAIDVDLGSHHGVDAWLDDRECGPGRRKFAWDAKPGVHTITLRIDAAATKLGPVVVRLAKAPGSSAEFTVVGGR